MFIIVFCIFRLGKTWAPKYCAKYQIGYRMIPTRKHDVPYRTATVPWREKMKTAYRANTENLRTVQYSTVLPICRISFTDTISRKSFTAPVICFWNNVAENTPENCNIFSSNNEAIMTFSYLWKPKLSQTGGKSGRGDQMTKIVCFLIKGLKGKRGRADSLGPRKTPSKQGKTMTYPFRAQGAHETWP